jgi:twitching motility protein PilT
LKPLEQLLSKLPELGASDLHIGAGVPPMLRINGDVKPSTIPPLTADQAKRFVFEILTDEQLKKFESEWNIDFAYALPTVGRFRGNVLRQRKGISAAFRYIPPKIPMPHELGVSEVVVALTKLTQGLVLVTGPTRSGKTTTLASLIQQINLTEPLHVITVEDPIEYMFQSSKALINQREVGKHTKSTANALRAALREDPDILMVGEMRDLETISLAITAAETGHLVLATLQTQSAHKTIDRMVDSFPPTQAAQIRAMLSESIRGVISQQLLKRADGRGMVMASEILLTSTSLSNLIRDGKTFQIPSVIQTGQSQGMQKMDDSILELVRQKKVTIEEAMRRAHNKKDLELGLQQVRKKNA